MAVTTRRNLRRYVSEAVGDYQSLTTTSDGTPTTLVSTLFKDLPGGDDDDGFKGFYEYQTPPSGFGGPGGNNANEFRRADLFTASSNTLRVARAHSFATVSGVTFELHRFDPADYHAAIQQAIAQAYPHLYLPVRDQTLVVDNLLLNPDFESAISGGAHPSWTNVGGPTVSAETSILMHGAQSAKVVAGGAVGQLTQAPTVNIREVTGNSARFSCWVYATAGSVARIRLDWDGVAFDSHAYHSGKDQWELMILTASVPSTATQVKAICEVAANGTAWFDAGSLTIMPVYRYTIPASMLKGPYYLSQQADEYEPNGVYYPLSEHNPPWAGRRLRLEGIGILTNPATDAETIEIGPPQVDYLVALAARNLNRILASRAAAQQRDRYLADALTWERQAQGLVSAPGIAMPRLGAQTSKYVWQTQEDATTRYILLDQAR